MMKNLIAEKLEGINRKNYESFGGESLMAKGGMWLREKFGQDVFDRPGVIFALPEDLEKGDICVLLGKECVDAGSVDRTMWPEYLICWIPAKNFCLNLR